MLLVLYQCYFRYTASLKRPNFWVHISPGSAETLARGGGITNQHLIVYSLSNISAKNYQNWLMCVEVIVCYIIVVFLRHSVYTATFVAKILRVCNYITSEYRSYSSLVLN